MNSQISQADVRSLQDLADSLGRNSRIAAPIFALGILATLIGAGIAIYFIVTLSSQLDQAQLELKQTEAVLEDTNRSLETANQALTEVQAQTQRVEDAPSAPDQAAAASETEANIEQAIMRVEQSQKTVADAKRNVTRVATALPAATQSAPSSSKPSDLSGKWVDGYDTIYTVSQEGSRFRYAARNTGKQPFSGDAAGTIRGRTATYKFSDNAGRTFDCRARIAADYQSMVETCKDPNGSEVSVTLVRT